MYFFVIAISSLNTRPINNVWNYGISRRFEGTLKVIRLISFLNLNIFATEWLCILCLDMTVPLIGN